MPSWLDNPDWTAHYDKGFQQGLQLRQQGMREQEFAQRRREFDVETALRNRQFQLQQLQIASQVIGGLSKQQLNAQTQAGFAALDQVMANAPQLGGWASDSFRQEFFKVAGQFPQVQMTPSFGNYVRMMDDARKAEAASAKAAADRASREKIAFDTLKIRGEQAKEIEGVKQDNRMLLEEFRQEGKEAAAESKLKNRIGDMGFQAYLGQKQTITNDKNIDASRKRRQLEGLYERALNGDFSRNVNSSPSNPATNAVPSGRFKVIEVK